MGLLRSSAQFGTWFSVRIAVSCLGLLIGCGSQRRADAGEKIADVDGGGVVARDATAFEIPFEARRILVDGGMQSGAALAVDGDNVYWLDLGVNMSVGKVAAPWVGGAIRACSKNGCEGTPRTLVADLMTGYPPVAPFLAAGGGSVYWVDHALGLVRCAADGCSSPLTPIAGNYAGPITLDGGQMYWAVQNTQVMACRIEDCSPSTHVSLGRGSADAVSALAIEADPTALYWCSVGNAHAGCWTCSVPDCSDVAPVTLAAYVTDVVTTERSVFALDSTRGIYKCSKTASDGCVPFVMTTSDDASFVRISSFATDGTNVYWAETRTTYFDGKIIETTGAVFKCGVDGCGDSPTVIAPGASYPDALTLDARSVYWIEDGTRIWKASK
jgi:hypothetical protein